MEQTISLNKVNRQAYSQSRVIEYYGAFDALFPAEKALFARLLPSITDSRILDIGIGGGRTTKYLLGITDKYTGIDYVPQFAEEASKKFPDSRVLCADAADLSEFEDQSFDFVLFSFNGLDYLTHHDRINALNEIRRVLRPGGHFMFSTHNRDYIYFNKLPWRRKFEFTIPFLKFFLYALFHLPKHFNMKKHEFHTAEYSVVNDSDHRYSLLHYYISISHQSRQLEQAGFTDVLAFDKDGVVVSSDNASQFIYYLATKADGMPEPDPSLALTTLSVLISLLFVVLLFAGCP